MIRAVAFAVPFAVALPALAGTPPVNSFETRLYTSARLGLEPGVESEDPLSSFFGSTSSFAEMERAVKGGLTEYASGDADLTVTGDASSWSADATLRATAARHIEGDFVGGLALFQHNFNLDIAAGEGFQLAMDFAQSTPDTARSFVQATLRLWRDDVIIYNRTATQDMASLQADFRRFEHIGANYRVTFLMTVESSFLHIHPGTGEAMTEATIGLNFAIIPAPMTAAPLAMGGLLALGRRRA